ncbi:MAG: hypothetical protein A3E83_07670 [Gammaproteobacteria bacterium RIFCSPHIGHO2_12_FULL_41_20]|nr:MAG: hypothetical protein A3E83_07670 [Gammaproteobacteria bacterium RIFCSPHIGHO2_12_FULL_41_20]
MNKTKTHRRNYDLSADLEKIKNAFSEAAMDVKEKTNDQLSQSMTEIKDQSVQVQNKVKKYIAENPFQSLGIALLAGVIIGLWVRK